MKKSAIGLGAMLRVSKWRFRNVTPTMVLALTVAAFPTPFALAGGRAVAEVQAETLIEEILGVGSSVTVITHDDRSATVFDGTTRLHYSGVVRHRDGSVSAQIQESVEGRLVATHVLQRGLNISSDRNKIEFAVETTSLNGQLTETSGSITKLSGGGALLQEEKDDGTVEASVMTFSSLGATSKAAASLASLITVVPVGMSAKSLVSASVAGCAVVIAVVVVAVVILCIFGLFWGC